MKGKFIVVATLLLVVALLCNGCRYSTVLEQIIHERHKTQVDYENQLKPVSNLPDNEIISDVMPNLIEDESSERFEDTFESLAQSGEEENNEPTTASDVQYDKNSESDAVAGEQPSGEGENDPDGAAQSGGQGETGQAQNQQEIDDNASGEGGDGDDGTFVEASAGANTAKQVVNAYGELVEIPKNVSSVGAVGEAALMVLMLSGPDMLAATSNETVSNPLACAAFPGLDAVENCWPGSGAAGIGDEEFSRLLDLHPQVCLEISGSAMFSEEQAALLQEQGIAYLVLPQITDKESLFLTMETIGAVLGDKTAEGGMDAPAQAAAYISWAEQILAQTAERTQLPEGEAVYTLFVDDWDAEAYYKIANDTHVTRDGYGVAVVKNKHTTSGQAITNFLSYAGVTNTTGLIESVRPRSMYYIPLVAYSRDIYVTGSRADELTQQRLLGVGGGLGTATFPALLAANAETAAQLNANELWDNFGRVYSSDGSFYADGFLDEDGVIISTQVADDYQTWVNPCGLSSWTSGTCESVLESVWAAAQFHQAYSTDELRALVRDFYLEFYHYQLSEQELEQIMSGALS